MIGLDRGSAKGRCDWLVVPCEPGADARACERRNPLGILVAIPFSASPRIGVGASAPVGGV